MKLLNQKGNALAACMIVFTVAAGTGVIVMTKSNNRLQELLGVSRHSPTPTMVFTSTLPPFSRITAPTTSSSATPAATFGTVTGLLCFPSEFLPSGSIIAKRQTDARLYTQPYPGSQAGGGNTYEMQLPPGSYTMKYDTGQFDHGYYTDYSSCINTDHSASNCAAGQRTRSLLTVRVEAGETTEHVNLCDFYYHPNNPPYF